MTKYREILRLTALGLSQRSIIQSIGVSQKTIVKVQRRAQELHLSWPLDDDLTDAALEKQMFPKEPNTSTQKRMPDFDYIRKELLRNGVNKKLLWTEYLEECRQTGDEPLMYSQFCYYIQQDEQKCRATMHINRKPGEQVEVDWAGDPAQITDPDTGEIIPAFLFVGVMTYSQYPYVEAFINEKQRAWIAAHMHMYEYFGGVARILVPDNTKTAVVHNNDWYNQELNTIYHEMAEHYNTAIIPARVRAPKDKPNAEGAVGVISTWITAALRNEQFFSLAELNQAIRKKLKEFVNRPFQKKEGTRYEIFMGEELPLLAKLPATPYELAEWKQATVQFNYHISVDGMLYSVPYEFIKRKVDVRVTDTVIEIFYEYNSRKSNSLKRLIKGAGLDQPEAYIAGINYSSGRKLNRNLIERLATCEYITEHRNLFITGATGSGKTYMACAFGMEACKQRYKTQYIRLPDMLLELDIARTNGTYRKAQAKYANPVLLIIDEWLLLKPTEAEQHDILELLHRRRKKSSTIFCSQYEPGGWYDQLGGDESPLAEAILDRIKHDAYKINIVPTDPANYRSMREVYGLDPELSE